MSYDVAQITNGIESSIDGIGNMRIVLKGDFMDGRYVWTVHNDGRNRTVPFFYYPEENKFEIDLSGRLEIPVYRAPDLEQAIYYLAICLGLRRYDKKWWKAV